MVCAVKRQLNAGEISLSKFLALCDAVGLDYNEVWNAIEKQDMAFYCHPALYTYFKALFHFKKTPGDIEKFCSISSASTERYLNNFQDIGIIKRSDNQYFKFLVSFPIDFSQGSVMVTDNIHKNLNTIGDNIVTGEGHADLL
ncbi:MAG: hypothetical protein HRU20_20630 [Pseudomonadales bacterium]|nr:hypothetical protein [Pseudomonadales bacterium]